MASDLCVRLAVPADAEGIANVLFEAFGAHRENYTPEAFEAVTPHANKILTRFDEGPQWVAEIDGRIVGTVSVRTDPDELYVRSMAVSPNVQGQGIGHKLMDAVNDYADASGHERIFLHTTYFVPGAKQFYESHGYKWVRDTAPEEWLGVPGIEMERHLSERRVVATG
jgi:predicted N-acetyltransferase YhbS